MKTYTHSAHIKAVLIAFAEGRCIQWHYGGKAAWCDLTYGDVLYMVRALEGRAEAEKRIRIKPEGAAE